MKWGTIYIQYGFWTTINKIGNEIFGPNLWDLTCVLKSNKVQAEFPIELFKEVGFLNNLWQMSNGSCFAEWGTIDNIIKKEENFLIERLCSVFLLDKEESDCNRYAQQKGILCFNADTLIKHNHLVTGGEKSKKTFEYLQKGSFYDLKYFFSYPCNSLILIDPHILKEKRYIKNHLKHLLSILLPQTLNMQFHLSIFSGIGQMNDAQLGESFYAEIILMLKEIRPKLDISFRLFQIPIQGDGWHDRYVITNNTIIEATAGFDLFGPLEGKIVAKRVGSFSICCPILNRNKDTEKYVVWLKKASKEALEGKGYHHARFIKEGVEENRLFDLVKD